MKLDFQKWLQETATSTGDVAIFARPLFSEPFTRQFALMIDDEKPKKKKKKKKD